MNEDIGTAWIFRILPRNAPLPAGWEWASEPDARYGSRWARRAE